MNKADIESKVQTLYRDYYSEKIKKSKNNNGNYSFKYNPEEDLKGFRDYLLEKKEITLETIPDNFYKDELVKDIIGVFDREEGLIAYRDDSNRNDLKDKITIEQQNFTIAHELGHAYIGSRNKELLIDFKLNDLDKERWNNLSIEDKNEEKIANGFAYEILMPSDSFYEECLKQDIEIDDFTLELNKSYSEYLKSIKNKDTVLYNKVCEMAKYFSVPSIRVLKRIFFLKKRKKEIYEYGG